MMSFNPLAEDDPQDPRLASAQVLPAVRQPAVEQRAVARLERLPLAVVAQAHGAVQHVEELHLAGLDDHLVGGDAARAGIERRDDRADLALEEPGAEHRPLLRGAVEGHDRAVLPARHVDAAGRRAVEQRGDRHAQGARDPAQRVERRRQPSRFDLRHHAGRQLRLLRELPLLQLALPPQRLDPLAERGHAGSSRVTGVSRPAIRASARATYTRVTFLRYGCVRSVLSSGRAGPAAASAAASITSPVSRWPTSAAAAFGASRGSEATAPSTMRASRTTSPSSRTAAATPRIGKSNAPRRRSLR